MFSEELRVEHGSGAVILGPPFQDYYEGGVGDVFAVNVSPRGGGYGDIEKEGERGQAGECSEVYSVLLVGLMARL